MNVLANAIHRSIAIAATIQQRWEFKPLPTRSHLIYHHVNEEQHFKRECYKPTMKMRCFLVITFLIVMIVYKKDNHSVLAEEQETTEVGEAGEAGEAEVKGETGVKEETGETGEAGVKGETGVKEETGETGETGEAEVKGEKGVKEETGETGEPGETGKTGETRKTGEAGVKGETGVKEETGETEEPEETGEGGEIGDADETEVEYNVSLPRHAERGEAPFTAIIRRDEYFCQGSIIHKHWVLTSAHCLSFFDNLHYTIVAGANSLKLHQYRSQIRNITDKTYSIIHENYGNIKNEEEKKSDEKRDKKETKIKDEQDDSEEEAEKLCSDNIGLIYVKRPFEFNDNVKAANLPIRSSLGDGSGKVYLWEELKSMELETLNVAIINHKECKKLWNNDDAINSKNICAYIPGYIDPTCGGTAGSSLVLVTPNTEVLVGILSYTDVDCGDTLKPNVYMSTFAYHDWIQNTVTKFYKDRRKSTKTNRRFDR
uniref:Peptidase S1 domain-containing protein n=1 Tax=Glossina brevipalpis TaxID=37001 RepID=A0A1A9WM46_9MUSC